MHVVGRLMTKQELLRSLRARLLLTAAVDAEPQILERPVAAPVIITGPARSGTSILFELLALDPDLRAPTAAEALHAVAPPEAAGLPEPLVLSECEQEFWADVPARVPGAARAALRPARGVASPSPRAASAASIGSMIGSLQGWMPDLAVNYAFERQFLQVLQHGAGPTQWVLKTPAHLMLLPLLFAEFGDAWVVQTHRDPAKTIPSTVSTTAMIQMAAHRRRGRRPGPPSRCWPPSPPGSTGSVQLRTAGAVPAERFVDVHFTELMSDPVTTLRAAYATMGRDVTDAHAQAVLDYLARKPKGKFGVHRYQPEDWGFTAQGLRDTMAPYIDHFGVTREG